MNGFIKDGDVIYDCGANIFDHSVFFALNNKKSTIVAFEPVKDYFDIGIKNMESFGVENIQPLNIALGEKRSKVFMSVENEASSLVSNLSSNKIEVEINTIDDLVETGKIKSPNAMKIDVEGFALPLLRGSEKTIRASKPIIFIEIHPQFVGVDEALEKISFLYEIGYKIVENYGEWKLDFTLIWSEKQNNDFEIWREKILANAERRIHDYDMRKVGFLRDKYDSAKNSIERKLIAKEYKEEFSNKMKISFKRKLIWSKLFVFFTMKWCRNGKK